MLYSHIEFNRLSDIKAINKIRAMGGDSPFYNQISQMNQIRHYIRNINIQTRNENNMLLFLVNKSVLILKVSKINNSI